MPCEHRDGMIICSRGRKRLPPCKFCQVNGGKVVPSNKLCDFPVGHGKTCDAPMCDAHATNLGTDVDVCPIHKGQEWPEGE